MAAFIKSVHEGALPAGMLIAASLFFAGLSRPRDPMAALNATPLIPPTPMPGVPPIQPVFPTLILPVPFSVYVPSIFIMTFCTSNIPPSSIVTLL